MWTNWFLVFLGGGLGSLLRFILGAYLPKNLWGSIPVGTFTVNIVGSLILGIIVGMSARYTLDESHWLPFATVGFCGGFTTFSTFAIQNGLFIQNGEFLNSAIYVSVSLVGGVLAILAGLWLGKVF